MHLLKFCLQRSFGYMASHVYFFIAKDILEYTLCRGHSNEKLSILTDTLFVRKVGE